MSESVKKMIVDLKRRILGGELKPGEALRQEEIASLYKVSRMPVREALKGLESLGLVDFIHNKGSFVAKLDYLEFRENFEMRASAETLAIRIAIPEISNRQIQHASQINETLLSCPLEEFGTQNRAFHRALYIPSQRPRLISHIDSLNDIADRYLRFSIGSFNNRDESVYEHNCILDACNERNIEKATDILFSHIMKAGEQLDKSLKTHKL